MKNDKKPYLLLYKIDGKQFAHITAANNDDHVDKLVSAWKHNIKAIGISISEIDVYPFNELVKEKLGFHANEKK
jgi:hypothetical protein